MKKCLIVLLAVAPIVGFTQTVYTAKKGAITDGSKIVTNVTFEGLATVADLAPIAVVATNAYDTATNALEVAQTAYNRPSITTNAVNDLSGALVSNHNASTVSHSDIRASVSNVFDVALGGVKTNSVGSLAIGEGAVASEAFSISLGRNTTASGDYSYAQGIETTASGQGSHAEGYKTHSAVLYGHAEGIETTASGQGSHAEGYNTVASGDYSHAEGRNTIASEYASHASGYNANAMHLYSFSWSGRDEYYSKGEGTFNINPVGGASGVYIGETNLQTFIDFRLLASDFYSSNSVTASAISALYASNVTTSARIDGKLPATYNSQLHTYDVPLENGVVGQLFQETHVYAMNRSGSTIANGKVVCVSGAQGDNVLIEPASASNPVCTWNVIGLVTEDAGIANKTSGYVTTFGNVNDLNTSMFAVSNTLWLAENGNLTNVEPAIVVGKSKIKIGTVIRSHVNEGRIFVSPQVVPNASDVGAATYSSTTNAVFYRQIATSASAVTSTVSVVPSVSIYRLTATNSTTIAFDTSALNTTNQVATWELWVLNASTNNSIVWPSTNSVYYIANPLSISANSQTIYTVWRKFGDIVQCNPYLVK